MKMQELKNKSDTELNDELFALRREQFNLRMQRGMQEAPRQHNFKRVRRTIARVKTILNIRNFAKKQSSVQNIDKR